MKAYLAANQRGVLLRTHGELDLIKALLKDMKEAGKYIVEGANLPSISGEESKPMN